jgi:hypothetical protein
MRIGTISCRKQIATPTLIATSTICIMFVSVRSTGSFALNMPVLAIVEAKRDNLESGVDQCAAQLYGASLINQGLGHPVPIYYGCVTNAREWLFLRFQNHHYTIDSRRYQLDRLPELLGTFQHILDYYRTALSNVPNP